MFTLRRALSSLAILTLLATSLAFSGAASAARSGANMRVTSLKLYQHMKFTGTCLPHGAPTLPFPANPMPVYAYGQVAGFTGKHTVRFIWLQTGGLGYFIRVHTQVTSAKASAPLSFPLCDTLNLTGPYPGSWTLRVTVDDILMKTVHFSIAPM